jgi:hypothetical protein
MGIPLKRGDAARILGYFREKGKMPHEMLVGLILEACELGVSEEGFEGELSKRVSLAKLLMDLIERFPVGEMLEGEGVIDGVYSVGEDGVKRIVCPEGEE